MSLDIVAVAGQVRQMGQDIASTQSDFRDCVRWARRMLQTNSKRYREVAGNIAESRQPRTSRAAVPMMEELAAHFAAPPCPESYVAAAADGSQAEPDRHGHVAYYLINTGAALIRYGSAPAASFHTEPRLCYRHDELYVVEKLAQGGNAGATPREALVSDEILAMKRSVAEIQDLARLAENIPADTPAILMIDGTLTLFAKASNAQDAWVGDQLVAEYQAGLDAIRKLGLPVVGFVSRSNASWVMDMMQLSLCERKADICDFCAERPNQQPPGCALAQLRDRFLYDGTLDEPGLPRPLQPGERSAVFQMSATLYRNYMWNEPAMFYLNSGHEIAQVQVPMWVAKEPDRLHQVHALVYAQCANGGGYPTVLTRAHERAVVTAEDRERLDNMVAAQLIKRGISLPVSEKARSKQVRGI